MTTRTDQTPTEREDTGTVHHYVHTLENGERVIYIQDFDLFGEKEDVLFLSLRASATSTEHSTIIAQFLRNILQTSRRKIRIVAKHHLQVSYWNLYLPTTEMGSCFVLDPSTSRNVSCSYFSTITSSISRAPSSKYELPCETRMYRSLQRGYFCPCMAIWSLYDFEETRRMSL